MKTLADRLLEQAKYDADVEILQKASKELKAIENKLAKIDKLAGVYINTKYALEFARAKIMEVRHALDERAHELKIEGIERSDP